MRITALRAFATSSAGGGAATLRYIDFVYQPIVDEGGAVVGIFSQGNDVTERVQAEEQLRRKQDELERMVEARTAALADAHAALKLANELQGDKMHLQRLFEQAPGFICVLRGPEHVYELANAAYRQLIGGREPIGRPLCDVLPEVGRQGFVELLDSVYRTGRPYIGRAAPVELLNDPAQGPELRYLDFIYQPVLDPTGQVIGIFVQGNDVVMPGPMRSPELARQARALHPNLAVLFTSGYTQNAIVHGGRLDPGVELLSKPYGREQLARKVRHLLANRPGAVPPPAPPSTPPAPRRVRILVAEDNPDLMEMACQLFEALGQEARGALNVDDALARLAEARADVLFTDIDLAGQSGLDLARRARALDPGLRVVFASGYGAPDRGALDFAFDVVAKPYRLDDLRALLERLA